MTTTQDRLDEPGGHGMTLKERAKQLHDLVSIHSNRAICVNAIESELTKVRAEALLEAAGIAKFHKHSPPANTLDVEEVWSECANEIETAIRARIEP